MPAAVDIVNAGSPSASPPRSLTHATQSIQTPSPSPSSHTVSPTITPGTSLQTGPSPAPNPPASPPAISGSIPVITPTGVLSFTQPPQKSTAYYQIAQNDSVTFGWKFSNVLALPASLTVSAACANGITYPVGPTNGVIPGTATNIVWDLYSYQTSNPQLPLVQDNYTLEIWGDHGPNATVSPGALAPNSALHFVLYTSLASIPANNGNTTISGVISLNPSHPALAGLLVTFLVMFLTGTFVVRRS